MGRKEKSIKNILFGFGAQAVMTLIHFFTKGVTARLLGGQIISMASLFNDIISCLSLAELGIGSAVVYNLYKPLAEGDYEKVSQLMHFFKKAYSMIAIVFVSAGTIACAFVQFIIKDIDFPLWYIRLIFMLFVLNSATSYLFSYKISLLNADQKVYIYSFYNTLYYIVRITINMTSLFLLAKYGDMKCYAIYLTICIITNLVSNILLSRQVDKRYSYLKPLELPKEDRKKVFDNVKNIFVKEVSGKITSSTDNILISILVSTIMVAPNHYYSTITGTLTNLINQVETGIKASMGNLFAIGSNEECEKIVNRLTWGYGIFAVWACTGIYVCSKAFISVWVGAQFIYDDYIVFIITINMFCYIVSRPIYTAMHVSGLFKEGRNISIIGSAVNLVVSIVFGKKWGIFGIFLGTFFTYLIQIILKIYYTYKMKFHKSAFGYSMKLVTFFVMLFAFMLGTRKICSFVIIENNILQFLVYGSIFSLFYLGFVVLLFRKKEDYKYFKDIIVTGIAKKFKRR